MTEKVTRSSLAIKDIGDLAVSLSPRPTFRGRGYDMIPNPQKAGVRLPFSTSGEPCEPPANAPA